MVAPTLPSNDEVFRSDAVHCQCPKPVIAEVGGIATAAGCQLVGCDLAFAADHAEFSTPGVHIGYFARPHGGAVTQCGSKTCNGNAALG